MASTIATVRDDIKDRLNIGTTESEPTDPMIDGWLASAFTWAITVCPPIFETTVTVDADRVATLDADDVLYVANDHRMLVPSEWNKAGDSLILSPSAASYNDQLQVWYFTMPVITTTVETSCVFGADWLTELATLDAMMKCEMRQMGVGASNDRDGHATMWRAIQTQQEALLKVLTAQRNAWLGKKEQEVAARAALGDGVNREGAYAGFINNSRIENRTTGLT